MPTRMQFQSYAVRGYSQVMLRVSSSSKSMPDFSVSTVICRAISKCSELIFVFAPAAETVLAYKFDNIQAVCT